MKKLYMKRILILILILVFVITVLLAFLIQIGKNRRTTYVLSPKICLALFGCEPNNFANWELDIYSTTEDFREKAFVDGEGNLVLSLNTAQKKAFRNKNWGIGVDVLRKSENMEITEDCTQITIYGYKETLFTDLSNFVVGASSLGVEQLLNGRDPSTIAVKIIVKDGVTGETVYSVVWPDEEFVFEFGDYQFSEKP